MSEDKRWQFELEEYIRQGEQEQADYTIQSAMEDVSKGKICTLDELRTNR